MDVDEMSPRGNILALRRSRPRIGNNVWIAPGAVVIGNVAIGDNSSVWFNCVLRGDTNAISIGQRTNIQDGTIVHVDPGPMSTTIGDDVTVGHGCILHGCTLMDRALVGMGSIVLNEAVVETDGMLAAGAMLTSGKRVLSRQLWAGSPAKLLRHLSDDEIRGIRKNAEHYVKNAAIFQNDLEA